jgi:hypothetical protein
MVRTLVDALSSASLSLYTDLLECFLLSGRVELKLKNYHQSLMYASIGIEEALRGSKTTESPY